MSRFSNVEVILDLRDSFLNYMIRDKAKLEKINYGVGQYKEMGVSVDGNFG